MLHDEPQNVGVKVPSKEVFWDKTHPAPDGCHCLTAQSFVLFLPLTDFHPITHLNVLALSMVQYPTVDFAGDLPATPSSSTILPRRACLCHDCVQAAGGVLFRAGGAGCAGGGAWAGGGLKVSQAARAAARTAGS